MLPFLYNHPDLFRQLVPTSDLIKFIQALKDLLFMPGYTIRLMVASKSDHQASESDGHLIDSRVIWAKGLGAVGEV
jgi:hypothetical protein